MDRPLKNADLFCDLVAREEDEIHLPAAAMSLARVEYPGLDPDPHLDHLMELGEIADQRLSGIDEAERLAALCGLVYREFGFRGNTKNYYDPRNSFLNDVLQRRLGIPITLTLVYIEIATACGWAMDPIGFPGHFLAKDVTSSLVVDPFNYGMVADEVYCRRLLEASGHDAKVDKCILKERLLAPIGKRQFLGRMINNLVQCYSADEEKLNVLEAMTEALKSAEAADSHTLH